MASLATALIVPFYPSIILQAPRAYAMIMPNCYPWKRQTVMLTLKRQFITDADGKRIGVILPVEEFDLVAETLEQRLASQQLAAKLQRMEQAAADPLFLADMHATMDAFGQADGEWWEHAA